jgi:hypothetical protein
LLGNEGFAVRQGNAAFAYFRPDNFVKLGNFTKLSLLRLENSAWYWLQVEDKMGRKGLYSPKGAVVLPVRYEKIIPWRGDLFCVQLNGKYGLVNQTGKLMLPPSYSALEYQKDGFIATLRNGKFGLIHMAREINIQPQYDKLLRPFDGGGNLLIAVKRASRASSTWPTNPCRSLPSTKSGTGSTAWPWSSRRGAGTSTRSATGSSSSSPSRSSATSARTRRRSS